jgi:hypothetical protein
MNLSSNPSNEPNCSLPERDRYFPTPSRSKADIIFYKTENSKDCGQLREWFYVESRDKYLRQIQLISKGEKRSKVYFLICSYRVKDKPELITSRINWVDNQDILPYEDYAKAILKAKGTRTGSKKNTTKAQQAKESSSSSSRGNESRCLSAYQRMTIETENAASAGRAGDACRAADGIERALNWLGTCESECSYDRIRMQKIAQYKGQLSSALVTYVRACGH